MQALYFAYGSNLFWPRMRARVPSARSRGPARLPGHRFTTDKRGRDGSGKANVCPDGAASVWGVLYQIDALHWSELDACELGYARVDVRVELQDGSLVAAETYRARLLTADPLPLASYKRFIVEGARRHGLPPDWVARLEALPDRPDPG